MSGKKDGAKRIPSDQPTALIAPSDYEHIFQDEDNKPAGKQKQKQQPTDVVKRVASDQPTALIAPSDFEHIYHEKIFQDNEDQKKDEPAKKIPSDTPTALIAPSDFEHIYRDPTVAEPKKKAKVTKAPKKEPSKQSNTKVSRKVSKSRSQSRSVSKERRSVVKQKQAARVPSAPTGSVQAAQEVLPPSIQNVVKNFIDKQKKTYTINK